MTEKDTNANRISSNILALHTEKSNIPDQYSCLKILTLHRLPHTIQRQWPVCKSPKTLNGCYPMVLVRILMFNVLFHLLGSVRLVIYLLSLQMGD
ncbi:hypothetical protein ASPBRDRAFT_278013 [Aspergillus brasiliensis CBS 101740]|uniref:Uncharacterized protein n=1 Tax=Aspergillus brasiliensis (strain CBS 101740 / IMI 381727 / IBT 21946) TaxID=767769 RepID=A0A1L9UCN6_ASPBC|nr:hypothetical protein ASPBRDRAFT_278013 [Aspergillus brasiliensis CBS 101740]